MAAKPDDASAVLSLAEISAGLGRVDESRSAGGRHQALDTERKRQDDLAQEVRRRPHDPAIRYQIGQSMQTVGRDRDALAAWFYRRPARDPKHLPTLEALGRTTRVKGTTPSLAPITARPFKKSGIEKPRQK